MIQLLNSGSVKYKSRTMASDVLNAMVQITCFHVVNFVAVDISHAGQKHQSSVTVTRGMLVEVLTHLCGRMPPGIPLNLPQSTSVMEKILQLYSTYDVILTFLK